MRQPSNYHRTHHSNDDDNNFCFVSSPKAPILAWQPHCVLLLSCAWWLIPLLLSFLLSFTDLQQTFGVFALPTIAIGLCHICSMATRCAVDSLAVFFGLCDIVHRIAPCTTLTD